MAEVLGCNLTDIAPATFTRLIERLLWHLNFSNVSNVDGTGDGGADLVATRVNPKTAALERWVFQAKSKQAGSVGATAVDETCDGMQKYNAHHGVVVTNTDFTAAAMERVRELGAVGVDIALWNRDGLVALFQDPELSARFERPSLRHYQVDAFQACWHDLRSTGRALVVLATGLGKTVIVGSVIDRFLFEHPSAKVLVLADKVELVEQLERSLWRHVTKDTATQQVRDGLKPERLDGVTVATIQSAIAYARQGFLPDLIFVDEVHHVNSDGQFGELLALCGKAWHIGATATPWRGDKFDITELFGPPTVRIGIEEGMRLGYLSDVHYRLYVDNIDWEYVKTLSTNKYSIGNLNRNLFLPQRDEQIRDELLDIWFTTVNPRGIVFCATIAHAEKLFSVLQRVPAWTNAACIHSQMGAVDRKVNLAKFRLGDIPLLVAVDVLNEGVDVPDVNIVCFARVTHSRRIFVQQLGRGLRLREGKTHVTVLDFVSDLKRIMAVMGLRSKVGGNDENVVLPSSHVIKFTDVRAESFCTAWLFGVADLETAADEVQFNFPPFPY